MRKKQSFLVFIFDIEKLDADLDYTNKGIHYVYNYK